MNREETQDKQYLALELTKIKYQSMTDKTDRSDIMCDYWYFLESLTDVFEKVARLEELEKENERMRILLAERVENPDNSVKLHRLIDVINQCKGDMEPYVYQQLMAEIQSKIQ